MLNSIVSKVYSNQQTSFSIIDVKTLKICCFYQRSRFPTFLKLLRIHFTPTGTRNCLHDAVRQRPERRTVGQHDGWDGSSRSFPRSNDSAGNRPRTRRQGPAVSSFCDDQGGQRAVAAALTGRSIPPDAPTPIGLFIAAHSVVILNSPTIRRSIWLRQLTSLARNITKMAIQVASLWPNHYSDRQNWSVGYPRSKCITRVGKHVVGSG